MLSAVLHAALSTSFSMLLVGLAALAMLSVLLTMGLSATTSFTSSYRVNGPDCLKHRRPYCPQVSVSYSFIYERHGRTS